MKQINLLLLHLFVYFSLPAQSTWTVVPSPNFSEHSTYLRGISGTSDTDIWAVGNYEVPQQGGMIYSENLILHFNGTEWTKLPVPGPDPTSPSQNLWDVTANSPENVWAVGSYFMAMDHVQILHYDGNTWKQQHFELPGSLYAIEAITPSDIWAVGRKGGEPVPNPALAMHYNGSSWTEVPVPIVGRRYQSLMAVDGIANDDVWAVGWWAHSRGSFMPMAMHWDGTSWNNIELPASIMDSYGELESVLMIASNDVWATGTDLITGENIVIHWDGTTWNEVVHPGSIGAIVGSNSDNIFTVGQDISQWNGESWQIIDDLNFGSYPTLQEGTILPSGEIWAVGTTMHASNDELNNIFKPLVMRSTPGQVASVNLPPDNYSIKAKDETCKNMSNGQLVITAKEEHNYLVSLNNETASFTHTKSITFEHLAPDTYYLDIMVEGEAHTKQSFEFEINPGMTFDANMTLTSSANQKAVLVQVLEGTAPFEVQINGRYFGKYDNKIFYVAVNDKDVLEINSSLGCEGILNMHIDLGTKASLFSNPVTSYAQIHLPFSQVKPVWIEIYNNIGQKVFSTYKQVHSDKYLHLDFSTLPAGIYYAKLQLEKPQTLKIIKQ